MYTLWFDHWNCSSVEFGLKLHSSGIRYEWEHMDGDYSTMGQDGLIYTFYSEEDLETASDIYLDM